MYFKSEYHEELFNQILAKLDDWQKRDGEYFSCAYLFAATEKKNIVSFMSNEGVMYEDGLREKVAPWSSSERALINLGFQFFKGKGRSLFEENNLITDIFWPLDQENMNVVLEAIKLKYGLK